MADPEPFSLIFPFDFYPFLIPPLNPSCILLLRCPVFFFFFFFLFQMDGTKQSVALLAWLGLVWTERTIRKHFSESAVRGFIGVV